MHWNRHYAAGCLDGFRLIYAATARRDVNAAVAKEATERGAWVNVVDDPEASTFVVPSTLRRGDLTIGISTGGASPAEAKRIRETLEPLFPESYPAYLRVLRAVRCRLIERNGAGAPETPAALRKLVASDLRERVTAGDWGGADRVLEAVLGPGPSAKALAEEDGDR